MKLCVVGGGKMAEALVGGLIATRWAQADEIGIIEVVAERVSRRNLSWGQDRRELLGGM